MRCIFFNKYSFKNELQKNQNIDINRHYTVYVHINKTNGKMYIGITGQSVKKRWQNGYGYKNQIFWNAIQKYGWNGFEHDIIASNLLVDEAEKLEKVLIEKLKTYNNKFGYNVIAGGRGNFAVPKPCYQYDADGNLVKYWEDIHFASIALNIPYSNITEVCNQKYGERTAGGYVFRFEPDDNVPNTHVINREYPIIQLTIDGNPIQRWNCIYEASKALKIHSTKIKECCNRLKYSSHGYLWIYEKDYMNDPEYLEYLIKRYITSTKYRLEHCGVRQFNLHGDFIAEYDNFYNMAKKLNFNYHTMVNIYYCAIGKYKIIAGHKWKLVDNSEKIY